MRLKQALEAPGGLVKMRSAEPHPPDFQITRGGPLACVCFVHLAACEISFPWPGTDPGPW